MDRLSMVVGGTAALIFTVALVACNENTRESKSAPAGVKRDSRLEPVSCRLHAKAKGKLPDDQLAGPGRYFPDGALALDSQWDRFASSWFSCHLAALQESPLYNIAADERVETYRALILPSFSPTYTIRIDRSAGRTDVTYKEVTGRGGHDPGALALSHQERLSGNEWDTFSRNVSAVKASGGVVPPGLRRRVFDGTMWVFESVQNGSYFVVNSHEANANEDLVRLIYFLRKIVPLNSEDRATEQRYKQVLAKREDLLGPEHPGVAHSLNDLAEFYRTQGRYEDAEPLYQRALAIWENDLGSINQYVAVVLENYAKLLRKTSRVEEAEAMEARAEAIRAKLTKDTPAK